MENIICSARQLMAYTLLILLVTSFEVVGEETVLPLQPEKIILTTDRTNYIPGDYVWLSGFVLNADEYSLRGNEYIMHVCMYSPAGDLLKHELFPIKNGTFKGQVEIPIQAMKGLYRLVAYTNFMRNWGDEFLCERLLWVGAENSTSCFLLDYDWLMGDKTDSLQITITTNKLEDLFLNISAQLYTDKGKPISTSILSVSTQTQITIPFSANATSDSLMLNIEVSDDQGVSDREIMVQKAKGKPDVQFLPESGKLLVGVKQRIAFKALGSDGFPINVSGKIVDTKGIEVADITTVFDGMGRFELTAKADETYTAEITDPSGKRYHYQLPEASKEGAIIQISTGGSCKGELSFAPTPTHTLSISQKGIQSPLKLVTHCRGKILKTEIIETTASQTLQVDISSYPAGIIHFTLVDEANQPVCERLVFHQPENKIKVIFPNFAEPLTTRQEVNLPIQIEGLEEGQLALYSISVVDDNFVHDYLLESAETQLYFSSELPGFIPNATYYLQNTPRSNAATDLLMLTNGWCRFEWKAIETAQEHQNYEVETSIGIKGELRHLLTNRTLKNNYIQGVFFGGGNSIRRTQVTDKEGKFRFGFSDIDYNLSVPLYISSKSGGMVKQARATIESLKKSYEIDYAKAEPITSTIEKAPSVRSNNTLLSLDKASSLSLEKWNEKPARVDNYIDTGGDTLLLPEVQVEEKRIKTTREEMRSLFDAPRLIISEKQILAMAKEKPWYSTLNDLLIEFTKGMKYRGGRWKVLNGRRLGPSSGDNMIYNSINPSLVTAIEVYRPSADDDYMRFSIPSDRIQEPPTIISIITGGGKGSFGTGKLTSFSLEVSGFTPLRVLYLPKYGIDSLLADGIALDARKTLFWDALEVIKSKDEKSYRFYTGDLKGKKSIVVNGFSSDGRPFYSTTYFNVGGASRITTTLNDKQKQLLPKRVAGQNELSKSCVVTVGAKTGKAIPYVTFSNGRQNFVSNNDGEVYLPREIGDTLRATKQGYECRKITRKNLTEDTVILALQKMPLLNATTSKAANALVYKAVYSSMIQMNKTLNLSSFYREKLYQNGNLMSIDEWELKSSYNQSNRVIVQINTDFIIGKSYRTFDFNEVVKVFSKRSNDGFPFDSDPLFVVAKFTDFKDNYLYNYTLIGETEIDGVMCYEVLFDVKKEELSPGYRGRIFIDKETFYIHEIIYEISLTNRRLLDDVAYVQDNFGKYDTHLTSSYFHVKYNCEKEAFYPLFIRSEIRISINNLTEQRFTRELIVSEAVEGEKVKKRELDDMQHKTYLVKNPFYDKAMFEGVQTITLPKNDWAEMPYLHEIIRYW